MKFKLIYYLTAVTLTSIRADPAYSGGLTGYGTSGLHHNVGYGNLNAYGAVGGSLDRFKGSVVYSRDRGYGYEKAYAYDREVSLDNSATKKETYGGIFALNDNTAQGDLNIYNRYGSDIYGNRGIVDASGYGRASYLNSGYSNHGVGVHSYTPDPARSPILPVLPTYRHVTHHAQPGTLVYGLDPTFEHSLAHTISPAHQYTSLYGEI
ncbi:uncharacterized protein LOC143239870 [Tachypleus tridentatus]|uniref:uncharacterized protein LOC143239870 n=1 Tax=Tachypleus tridentatus TaxID=6853 RepID=UPI003FD1D77E